MVYELGSFVVVIEMTDLHFLIAANSVSTPLGEGEEPFRKCPTKAHSISGGGHRLHKWYSMPLGDFAFVPVPVHVDTKA